MSRPKVYKIALYRRSDWDSENIYQRTETFKTLEEALGYGFNWQQKSSGNSFVFE